MRAREWAIGCLGLIVIGAALVAVQYLVPSVPGMLAAIALGLVALTAYYAGHDRGRKQR